MTAIQGLQAMPGTPGMDQAAAKQAKLVDAAHQFEGMLLQEMLKGMQSGKDELGGGGDDGDNSGDTLRSLGTEAVAKAISMQGGIGLAKLVIAKVTKESDVPGHHGTAPTMQ